ELARWRKAAAAPRAPVGGRLGEAASDLIGFRVDHGALVQVARGVARVVVVVAGDAVAAEEALSEAAPGVSRCGRHGAVRHGTGRHRGLWAAVEAVVLATV